MERAPTPCAPGEDAWVLTLMFFGLSSRDGRGVSEQAWDAFLATVVTPRFSSGFTVVPATGQYLEEGRVAREATKLLMVTHPGSARDQAAIAEIGNRYKQTFSQESVFVLNQPTCASLR
jgi:hypothetical protein